MTVDSSAIRSRANSTRPSATRSQLRDFTGPAFQSRSVPSGLCLTIGRQRGRISGADMQRRAFPRLISALAAHRGRRAAVRRLWQSGRGGPPVCGPPVRVQSGRRRQPCLGQAGRGQPGAATLDMRPRACGPGLGVPARLLAAGEHDDGDLAVGLALVVVVGRPYLGHQRPQASAFVAGGGAREHRYLLAQDLDCRLRIGL